MSRHLVTKFEKQFPLAPERFAAAQTFDQSEIFRHIAAGRCFESENQNFRKTIMTMDFGEVVRKKSEREKEREREE